MLIARKLIFPLPSSITSAVVQEPEDRPAGGLRSIGESVDDLVMLEMAAQNSESSFDKIRYGMMVVVKDLAHLEKIFDRLLERYHPPPRYPVFINILII